MLQVYAYFLPQFHSTPENDAYWRKSFTVWSNVKKGIPFFKRRRKPLFQLNKDHDDLSGTISVLTCTLKWS